MCDAEPSLPSITRCLVNLVREFKQIPASAGRRGQLRSDDLPLDPSFVYDTIEECGSSAQQGMLSKGNQEDAQEFLNHILLLVHEEMVRGLASTSGSGEGNDYGGQSGGDEWMHIKKNQKKSILRDSDDFKESPVSYVFGGKLRSVRKLHGAKEFENVEPFFMLDLPIQVSHSFWVAVSGSVRLTYCRLCLTADCCWARSQYKPWIRHLQQLCFFCN